MGLRRAPNDVQLRKCQYFPATSTVKRSQSSENSQSRDMLGHLGKSLAKPRLLSVADTQLHRLEPQFAAINKVVRVRYRKKFGLNVRRLTCTI